MGNGVPREIAAVSIPHPGNETRHRVTGYLRKYSPSVWSRSPDLYLLDLTGTTRLLGRPLDTCGRIIRDLDRRFQLAACIGIGSTLLVARLAARIAGPHGVYQIPAWAGYQAVGQLSIWLLPNISRETKEELTDNYLVRYIRDLSVFTREDLTCLFGEEGKALWSCSQALIQKPLSQRLGEKIIQGKTTIERDWNNNRVIRRVFFRLLSELAARLREEDLFPMSASFQVVYRDNRLFTRRVRLRRPSYFETDLYPQLVDHLNRALERKMGIGRINLMFTRFIHAYHQLELFPEYTKSNRLLRACDTVHQRFGREYLRPGT